jgi:hypothetical protein
MTVNSVGEHRKIFFQQIQNYAGLCVAIHQARGVIIAAKKYEQVARRVELMGLQQEVIIDILPSSERRNSEHN